jgi:hypothetical protein
MPPQVGSDEVRWISGVEYREVVALDADVSWPVQPRFYDHGQALFALGDGVHAMVEHHRQASNASLAVARHPFLTLLIGKVIVMA